MFRRDGAEEAVRFSRSREWPRSELVDASDENAGAWEVGGSVTFHFALDVASGESCCYFQGLVQEEVDRAFLEMCDLFDTWTLAELIEGVRSARSSGDLVAAVFRLGLGAPPVFTARFYNTLCITADHKHPMVRAATMRTIAYMEWPELHEMLDVFVRTDPDERVRREASLVIEAFERVGIRRP